jgi:hypothetical protein
MRMAKLLGNVALLIAGGFLFLGATLGVGVLFVYAFGLVMARRLKAAVGFPTLTAGG